MPHQKQAKPVIFPKAREDKKETQQENPFDPYKMFSHAHYSPFLMSHTMLHKWFEMYQKFWLNWFEFRMWQNKSLMDAIFQSSRWYMHSFQLMGHPQIFSRYLRANWQKPFMAFNAQTLSAARLMTHMMMENGMFFQKAMSEAVKNKQSHTHH